MSPANPTLIERGAWMRGALKAAGGTDPGVVRPVNQDAFGLFDMPDRGESFVVVADGLGGHLGGEVASRTAVDHLAQSIEATGGEPAERLSSALLTTNQVILATANANRELDGMGTTVVAVLFAADGEAYVGHVGDSRLYRLRNGSLSQVTHDHSLVATLVREGVLTEEEARRDPRRNQILRALGVREDTPVDVAQIEFEAGDQLILCSDGLHGMIEDGEIARISGSYAAPQDAVTALIAAANKAGGTDNISCVLVRFDRSDAPPPAQSKAGRLLASTRALLTRRSDDE